MNDILDWHKSAYSYLMKLSPKLPHAILIHGAKGLGKRSLALNFIYGLLCQNKAVDNTPCGKCQSCSLLEQISHPDFLHLKDESEDETKKTKNITIEQINSAIDFVSLSPHLGSIKIVFIEDVALLGINSANALLKILEEPPAYALFILVSDNLSRVLPTIISRCHKFRLTLNAKELQAPALLNEKIFDYDFWLNYYDGSPLFELELNQDQFNKLIATTTHPSVSNILGLTSEIDGKKVSFAFFIGFMLKWISDLASFNLSGKLKYFTSYANKVDQLNKRLSLEKLFALQDELTTLSRWTNHPLNYKLQIENLLFKYQQVFR